jgi:predicted alpha/beta-fold hydrolase
VAMPSSRDVFVGRRSELDTLSRLHDEAGPRVLFVHGLAGSGKSCLVQRFAQRCAVGDPLLVVVDCRAVEPTEQGFLAAVADGVRGFAHSTMARTPRASSCWTASVACAGGS